MSKWYVASNITPGDNSGLDMCPNPGDYTDLVDGDKALVSIENEITAYKYNASSSATESLPQVITPNGNAGNGRWLLSEFAVPGQNGFAGKIGPQSNSLATIGVVGTTFTLTHVADYHFYVEGVRFDKTANETVEITDVEGIHWIYFDNTGTIQIQAPGGSTDDLILDNCLIAAVSWDATNNVAIVLLDERHMSNMSPATHYHFHETDGAKYESGMALSNFSVDGTGNDAVDAQFDINSGEFHDEDNEISIPTDADATIDTFYRDGVGGAWRKAAATAGYVVADGQTVRLDWNDYNGGTWQRVEVTNNRYVLTHYFATNDQLSDSGIVGIMGQAEYNSLNAARTGAETELGSLLLGDLPLTEVLPIATVIWQTASSYSNQVAARIRATDTGDDYIDWRTSAIIGSGSSSVDHESLSGLLGGAAADHYHVTGAQHDGLTDGSATDLHKHETLYYDGTKALVAQNDGVDIWDTSAGDAPNLGFKTDGGVIHANVSAQDTVLTISANVNEAHVKLQSKTTAGVTADILKGDPDGAVELYYNNLKSLSTTAAGINVFDTAGVDANVVMVDSSGNEMSRFRGETGKTRIMVGSTPETAVSCIPNGAVELYHNNLKALQTSSIGMDVISPGGTNAYIASKSNAGALLSRIYSGSSSWQLGLGSSAEVAIEAILNSAVVLYHNGLLALSTDETGILVQDTAGTQAEVTFRSNVSANLGRIVQDLTHMYLQVGSSFETAIKMELNGATELYYNNLLAMQTSPAGIEVFDTAGNDATIAFKNDAGSVKGQIVQASVSMRADMWNGSGYENLWIGRLNGAVELYYNNLKAMDTNAAGITVYDTAGAVPGLVFRDDAANKLAQITVGATQLFIQMGAASETIIEGNLNGAVDLYYNNLLSLKTTAFGAEIRDTDGTSANIGFRDSLGNTMGNINVQPTVTTHQIGNAPETAIKAVLNGAVELYYDNLLAMLTTGSGIEVRDTNGSIPEVIFKTDGGVVNGKIYNSASDMILYLGASFEKAVQGKLNGAVELYYNNLKTFETTGDGISVRDGSGTDSRIRFLSSVGAGQAQIISLAADLYFRNEVAGGHIRLQSDNTSGALTDILNGDPDGITQLYYSGTRALSTGGDGINVYDTSGTTAALAFFNSSSVKQGQINCTATQLIGYIGSPAEKAWVGNLNGAVELYHNNLLAMSTAHDGIKVRDASGSTPVVTYANDAGTNQARIYATATQLVQQLWNGSAYETAIKAYLNGSVEVHYNGLKALETSSAGGYVFDTSGTDPQLWMRGSGAEWLGAFVASATGIELTVGGSDAALVATDGGAVELYYDNVKEAETVSGGLKATNALQIGTSLMADDILDEDNMASDSATALVTQQSVKAYVDAVALETVNPNIIINGDMDIGQRGTSFTSVANNTYTLDRFVYLKSSTAVHTVAQSSDVPTEAQSGHLSSYSLLADVTTADTIAAGEYVLLAYKVEGYDFKQLQDNTGTLSFWVKNDRTGTFCVGFRSGGADASYIAEYTINAADTWEKKTITVDFSDSIGTWDYETGIGINIYFTLACGSTYQTTADAWQSGNYFATSNQEQSVTSTDDYIRLAQVKLEMGGIATPFVSRPFGEELALCQRYYEKSFPYGTTPANGSVAIFQCGGTAYATTAMRSQRMFFKVQKNGSPTITLYSPTFTATGSNWDYYTGAAWATATTISHTVDEYGMAAQLTTTGLTTGHSYLCAGHWTAQAEL